MVQITVLFTITRVCFFLKTLSKLDQKIDVVDSRRFYFFFPHVLEVKVNDHLPC